RSNLRLFFRGLKMISVKSGPSVTSTPTRIFNKPVPPIVSKYGGGYHTRSMTVTTVAAISTERPRWIAAAFQRLRETSVIWNEGIGVPNSIGSEKFVSTLREREIHVRPASADDVRERATRAAGHRP